MKFSGLRTDPEGPGDPARSLPTPPPLPPGGREGVQKLPLIEPRGSWYMALILFWGEWGEKWEEARTSVELSGKGSLKLFWRRGLLVGEICGR